MTRHVELSILGNRLYHLINIDINASCVCDFLDVFW